jgi:hypothetical protein
MVVMFLSMGCKAENSCETKAKLSSDQLSYCVLPCFFNASVFCAASYRNLASLTFGYVLQGVVDTALSKVGLSEHLLVVQLLQLANQRE